ncbi:MAG: hypothetical protein PHN73_05410 [Eubacteriales bacterium]|nr:hypothetical protein [Eubacteriales bacterium]
MIELNLSILIVYLGGDNNMEMYTVDYVKKALLDTQERVRDFKAYSSRIEDNELKAFFREYSLSEGKQAQKLQKFLDSIKH